MEKRIDIPAVHDKDLEKLLTELQVIDSFVAGKIHCPNCGTVITWENLFALKVKNSEVLMYCDKINCKEKASANGR